MPVRLATLPRNVSSSFIDLASAAAAGTDETLRSSKFAQAWKEIATNNGVETQREILRTLITTLLDRGAPRIDALSYPLQVKKLIHIEFSRIYQALDGLPPEYFDFGTYRFRSDLRIAGFGRVPVGPEHLEIDGVPRSVLYRNNATQALRFLSLLSRSGGVRPYYVLHFQYGVDPATFLFVYSRKAQESMFRNLAACLEMNTSIRGVLATSWWHDPQLETLSPYLAYLRSGWTERGAYLFRWGTSSQDVQLATSNSPHRREAYERGEYRPMSYMVVWLRESLLRWARSGDRGPEWSGLR